MSTPMLIIVGGIPISPNKRPGHWGAKYRHDAPLKEAVAWQARAIRLHRTAALERAHVRVRFTRPGGGPPMDRDNAVATCKCLIDGLVEGGLLVDDNRDRVELEVVQERGARTESLLTITEVP